MVAKSVAAKIFKIGSVVFEKKEEIWLSPMTKAPTPTEMSKRHSDNKNKTILPYNTMECFCHY